MTGFGGWKNWIVKLENFPQISGWKSNTETKMTFRGKEKRGPRYQKSSGETHPCTDIGLGDAEQVAMLVCEAQMCFATCGGNACSNGAEVAGWTGALKKKSMVGTRWTPGVYLKQSYTQRLHV